MKVYLEDQYVGDLIGKNGQSLRFVYVEDATADISLKMPHSTQIYKKNLVI